MEVTSTPAPRHGWRALIEVGGVFGVSLSVFVHRISTPAPWIDEAATFLAVHRGWRQLAQLLGGADAPLVPYYYLLKLWLAAARLVTGAPPEIVQVRLLSAVAAAGAVSCLAVLLARYGGRLVAAAGAVILVGMAGFDRFAQEARPYSLLALAGCLSWLLWDRWRTGRRARAGAWYAASGAVLSAVQLFGVFLLPAQLLAEFSAPRPPGRRRWREAGVTLAWVVAGQAIVAPLTLIGFLNGTGPRVTHPFSALAVWQNLAGIVSANTEYNLQTLYLLVLAGIGLATIRTPRWGALTRILAWWALLPTALAVALAVAAPHLLRPRYWIGVLPALAGLAAVGVVALGEGLVRGLRRLVRREVGRPVTALVMTVTIVGLIGAHLGTQWPKQLVIRRAEGHDENLRPALSLAAALVRRSPQVPMVTSPATGAAVLAVIDPRAAAGNALFVVRRNAPGVWPEGRGLAQVERDLGGATTLLWLYRDIGIRPEHRRREPNLLLLSRMVDALPAKLRQAGFEIHSASSASPGWTLVVLHRSLTPPDRQRSLAEHLRRRLR